MRHVENLILGAGIAGLGSSYKLRSNGGSCLIVEKDSTYGGLCGCFEINGFRFDRFVHLTFSNDNVVNAIFRKSCDLITHIPNPYNIYNRKWIKYPAQNNLFPLSEDEKNVIIDEFAHRPAVSEQTRPQNYEEWLRLQFGNYFAEHFPMVYTRKYWMREASQLRTEWVGNRVYQPSLAEVIQGSKTSETPVTYYAKEMRYPAKGGFKALLNELVRNADIEYNKKVLRIDAENKVVSFADGTSYGYDRLISSIPLPEMARIVENVPEDVKSSAEKLNCTSGYHISIALRTKNIPPYLWWYIYDEDILAARVYSPSLKSPDNAPDGCSSLQMEVYCKEGTYTDERLLAGTVGKLVELGIVKEQDILFTYIGFEKYANVIFTQPVYESRKVVRDWLSSHSIETIGRFGVWDYLWSDQSLVSGMNIN